jgi:hypothetical protein
MFSLSRIVFISSLSIIAVIVGFRTLLELTPLEYSSQHAKSLVNTTTGICIPLAIALTLSGTLRDKDRLVATISKVILTLFIAFLSILVILVSGFSFCGWSDQNTVYCNDQSSGKIIVTRKFGCGAIDGGPSRTGVFEIRPFLPGLNWTTEVDTLKIDRAKWTRCETHNQLKP